MDISDHITNNREIIEDEWRQALSKVFPEGFRKLLNNNADKFTNPVGYTVSRELPVILDEIIAGSMNGKAGSSMSNIMKIMAVQDINPSDSISFMFRLKDILLKYYGREEDIHKLLELFTRIDKAALSAFDIYMKTREKIYEIKANEVKARFGKMVERINSKYSRDESW